MKEGPRKAVLVLHSDKWSSFLKVLEDKAAIESAKVFMADEMEKAGKMEKVDEMEKTETWEKAAIIIQVCDVISIALKACYEVLRENF